MSLGPLFLDPDTYSYSIPFLVFGRHSEDSYSKSGVGRLGRTFRLICPEPAPVVFPIYEDGFAPRRVPDWDSTEDQEPGPINPSLDAHFCPAWMYQWAQGESLAAPNAWFKQTGTALIWDGNWLSGGYGLWARANDTYPIVGRTVLRHVLNSTNWLYVPMLKWKNCKSGMSAVALSGSLVVEWSGSGGVGSPVTVDVAVGIREQGSGLTRLVFGTTVEKPTPADSPGDSVIIPIEATETMLQGDAIVLSLRGRNPISGATRWVNLYDDAFEVRVAGAASVRVVPTEIVSPSAWPNPSRGSVWFDLGQQENLETAVAVFDMSGRLVRDLVKGRTVERLVRWDGMDDAGRPAASGRYVCRISRGSSESCVPVVLIR